MCVQLGTRQHSHLFSRTRKHLQGGRRHGGPRAFGTRHGRAKMVTVPFRGLPGARRCQTGSHHFICPKVSLGGRRRGRAAGRTSVWHAERDDVGSGTGNSGISAGLARITSRWETGNVYLVRVSDEERRAVATDTLLAVPGSVRGCALPVLVCRSIRAEGRESSAVCCPGARRRGHWQRALRRSDT